MNLFSWLRPATAPTLSEAQSQRLAALPRPEPWQNIALKAQRWVVVDVETTGLNVNRDQVLSIGAVVLENGAVTLRNGFERTLRRTEQKATPSVLIHGLSPNALAAGSVPADALLDFLEYLGSSPLLAFHAPFDQRMLARAMKESLGYRFEHPFLDMAELAPMLNAQGPAHPAGLDDWIAWFGLEVGERHHAAADALVTAELAMLVLSQARRQEISTPALLEQSVSQWRRRRQTQSF